MDAHINLQCDRAIDLSYTVSNQNNKIDKLEANSERHSEESRMNKSNLIE